MLDWTPPWTIHMNAKAVSYLWKIPRGVAAEVSSAIRALSKEPIPENATFRDNEKPLWKIEVFFTMQLKKRLFGRSDLFLD